MEVEKASFTPDEYRIKTQHYSTRQGEQFEQMNGCGKNRAISTPPLNASTGGCSCQTVTAMPIYPKKTAQWLRLR